MTAVNPCTVIASKVKRTEQATLTTPGIVLVYIINIFTEHSSALKITVHFQAEYPLCCEFLNQNDAITGPYMYIALIGSILLFTYM